jgi:hypothetical protein
MLAEAQESLWENVDYCEGELRYEEGMHCIRMWMIPAVPRAAPRDEWPNPVGWASYGYGMGKATCGDDGFFAVHTRPGMDKYCDAWTPLNPRHQTKLLRATGKAAATGLVEGATTGAVGAEFSMFFVLYYTEAGARVCVKAHDEASAAADDWLERCLIWARTRTCPPAEDQEGRPSGDGLSPEVAHELLWMRMHPGQTPPQR